MLATHPRAGFVGALLLLAAAGATAEETDDIEVLLETRDLVRAEAIARERLAAAEASGDRTAQAGARDGLIRVRLRARDVDEDLLAFAEETLARKRALFGADHSEVATSLYHLGACLDLAGRPDEGKAHMDEALAMRRRVLGDRHPDVARSLAGLGIYEWRNGRLAEAEALLEQALDIQDEVPATAGEIVGTLQFLSLVQAKLGEIEEAVERARRAVFIREDLHGAGHPRTAEALHNLGAVYSEAAALQDALATELRAAAALEGAATHWDWLRAPVFNNLANFEGSLGNFPAARSWAERSVDLLERMYGADSADYAFGLNSLGLQQLVMGDLDSARRAFERVLAVYEATLPADHRWTLLVLTDLASVEHRSGNFARAVELLERAVPGIQEEFGDGGDAAFAWGSLGEARLAAGDVNGAIAALERSRTMIEGVSGPESADLPRVLGLLARAHTRNGNREAAELFHVRCLDLSAQASGEDSILYESELRVYARFLFEGGEMERAFEAALRADELSRNHVRINVRGLAEREALAFLGTRSRGTDVLMAVVESEASDRIDPRVESAWDAVIRSRCLVLDEMIERNRAVVGTEDAGVAAVRARYREAGERLAGLWLSQSAGGASREEVDAARAELEQSERALADASASFRDAASQSRAGFAEVRSGRPARSAVVAYARYDAPLPGGFEAETRYFAFVLPADGMAPRAVSLGPADQIDGLVRTWRATLVAGESAAREAGSRLRESVWDPVAPLVGEAPDLVLVVLDGALHEVSLAALPDGDGGYLVETGPTFHHLSSERDAARVAAETTGRGLLVVGGADYDADPRGGGAELAAAGPAPGVAVFRGAHADCRGFAEHRFEQLPATSREARDVATLWGPDAALLEGDAATEAAFRAHAPGRRVLHLATHGFFLGGDCRTAASGERGVTGVVPLGDAPSAGPPLAELHPLLASGVALAGANRRARVAAGEDDGILTAQEIGALDLGGVEWAVLSACDTGIGRVAAEEGVLGLQRAFAVAGARTVLMTLWPVKDEDAHAWMSALYARRAAGAGTAEAVRASSLQFLRQLRERGEDASPARWGGLVAVGDWR
ncbi:MAG: CHAT domain-containing protein [Candidatus Eiseniibacteriota bacterium]